MNQFAQPHPGSGSFQSIGGAPPDSFPGGQGGAPQPQMMPETQGNIMPPDPGYGGQYGQQPMQAQYGQQRPPQFAAQPFAQAPPQQSPFSPSGTPMSPDPLFGRGGAPAQPLSAPAAGQQQPYDDGLALGGPAGGMHSFARQAPQQQPQQPPAQQYGWLYGAGAQQSAAQPQRQPTSVVRDALAQRGINVGQYADDEALLADLGSAALESGYLRQMAGLGQEYLRQNSGGGQPQQTTQQPGQQGTPQQPQGGGQVEPPKAPEWRPEWGAYVRMNPETGLYEAKDPMATSPLIVQRANERAGWEREQRRRMDEDPVGYLRERGLDKLLTDVREQTRQEVLGGVAEVFRAQHSQETIGRWVDQNAARFCVVGQDGRLQTNPYTNQPLLNPTGQMAQKLIGDFRQHFEQTYGRQPDATTVIKYVDSALAAAAQPTNGYAQPNGAYPPGGQFYPQNGGFMQPQPPFMQPAGGYPQLGQVPYGQPYDPNQAMKDHLIQRAIAANGAFHVPGAGGTVAAAANGVAQNTNANLGQLFQQGAIARGIARPDQF